ncbi:hypothetical protein K1T71_011373 [Dendrolimus kikuchii]|uniref:Uncharacterized protein n=1 Tax=Dendrolimus kikuchii TaxID=765133 RepID=A0ACC1CNZ4_9NEOP|nr:hypothetical protein K1T71_011373 [Dendrolimus kikuchii]
MEGFGKLSLLTVFLVASISAWFITNINNVFVAAEDVCMEDDLEDISFEEARKRFNLMIFPGTKWCGAGNTAENYDDLGSARETDMCCRDHDNCPDLILAGETQHNLTNDAFYTRLNCGCDEKFRQCLNDANSRVANKIGKIYFNALGTQCYREDYPIKSCIKRGGWFKRKCVEYEYDTESPKKYQWFDVINY